MLSLCKLSWLQLVREDIPRALQKIVPQEESSQGVLHTPAHLHQVPQDVLPAAH